MIDERINALIHADVDGRLPDGERAELARYLLQDPEARALHRDLCHLRQVLAAVGTAEVPRDLQHSLMDAIPPEAGGRRGLAAMDASRPVRRPRGFAVALAAGAALGAVVLALTRAIVGVDGQDAVGTMAARSTRDAGASLARIDRPQIDGTVRVDDAGSAPVVELVVAVHDAVDVVAAHDGRTADLAGLQPTDGVPQRYRLELPGGGDPREAVTVRIRAGGEVIEEVTLALPGAR